MELFSQAEARAGARAQNSGNALEQTKALADTLASDKDGKFANSKFLQFISKMSRGEIILEGNEVRGAWGSTLESRISHKQMSLSAMCYMVCVCVCVCVCLQQAKQVSAESAAWASEFADKQEASKAADFEDIWKHYGEVRVTYCRRVTTLCRIIKPL